MRIISQDKTTDISYDGAVIYTQARTENQICVIAHVPDEDFLIGTYNSKEDAIYVLALIRTAFKYEYRHFYMPEAEKVSTIRKEFGE